MGGFADLKLLPSSSVVAPGGPSRGKWPTGVRETHFTGPVPFSTGPVTGVAHCAGRSARSRRPSGQAKVDPPSETPPPASPRSRGAKRAPSLSALRRLTCPRAPFTCLPRPGAPAPAPQADLRGPEPPRRRTPGRRRARWRNSRSRLRTTWTWSRGPRRPKRTTTCTQLRRGPPQRRTRWWKKGYAEAEEEAGNLEVLRDYLKMEHGVAGEVMEALGSFGKD